MNYKITKEELAHQGFLSITRAEVTYDSFRGQPINATREMMDRGDSVAVLLYEEDTKTILLTNQFRYPAARKDQIDGHTDAGWLLELPAGKIDEHESPDTAGLREVEEEIGYHLPHANTPIHRIAQFYVSPGGTSERIYIYYCKVQSIQKSFKGGGLISEKEDIQLIKLPMSSVQNKIDDGTIRDAKTIIALQWWLLNKQ